MREAVLRAILHSLDYSHNVIACSFPYACNVLLGSSHFIMGNQNKIFECKLTSPPSDKVWLGAP